MTLLSRIRAERDRLGGKGISHRPDLASRVHVLQQFGDQTVAAGMDEYADYAKVYGVYVWVRKAISKIGEAMAPLSVRVVDGDGEEQPDHPVSLLLANANDTMSPADVWQRWVVHMMLGGESFFELVNDGGGRPVEIWPRRPDQVKVRPDKSPERALYPRVAGYVFGESSTSSDQDLIEPEDMWHTRFYNPLNVWRGLAPIAAVREGITIDLFAQAWSKAFLKRGARPDYALVAPQGITASEREDYEQRLMTKFSGSDNWHRPIILEDGVTDIKTFSFTPKDIEWLEQRKFSRDEVGGIFGVPDEVMGFGRDTYENMDAAHRWFWLLTLRPLVEHRDTGLTHFFTKVRPLLGPGERVASDLTGVAALQEDLGPKVEMARELWAMGVPFNVIDERLKLGIGEVPGGDTAYLPFNLMPTGRVSSNGGGEAEARALLRALVAQVAAPEAGGWLIETALEGQGENKGVPEFGGAEHEARWKAYAARLEPHEQRMGRQLKRDFQRQQTEVLRALRGDKRVSLSAGRLVSRSASQLVSGSASQLVSGSASQRVSEPGDGARGKQDEIPFNADDLLDWRAEVEWMAQNYEQYFEETVAEFGQAQLDALELLIDFDLRNPLVEQNIKSMAMKFAKDINATTQAQIKAELREVLTEADEEGWAIPDIQREIYSRISQVFDVRKSDYETERIARTEMNKAANAGNLDGMRQSGVVEKKAWLAALDDRVRPTHEEAHHRYDEKPIALEAMFEVGADRMVHPGGGSLPEENIFCRCTAIAVIE